MIVFKTFLKVLNKCKWTVLLYTGILLFFAIFNMSTSDNNLSFEAERPDVTIIVEDEMTGITEHFVNFLKKHANIKDINEEDISDALFYRDINILIRIPKGFRANILSGEMPQVSIKSTGDYQASLANVFLEKYLKTVHIYQDVFVSEEEIMKKVDETLQDSIPVLTATVLDTNELDRAKYFYNFANYAILAGAVYVICMILAIFRNERIAKRTRVSSMNYKKFNGLLMVSNGLFVLLLWALYALISIFLVGDVMFETHGLFFLVNSLLFSFCGLSLSFFIGNLITSKDAISGLVNVIALGSSFLCGAFVPVDFLPNSVLWFAHILPSYWYIHANEIIATLENFQWNSIYPVITCWFVLIVFIIFFAFLTNIVSRKKI